MKKDPARLITLVLAFIMAAALTFSLHRDFFIAFFNQNAPCCIDCEHDSADNQTYGHTKFIDEYGAEPGSGRSRGAGTGHVP